jgi:hypothetical protein
MRDEQLDNAKKAKKWLERAQQGDERDGLRLT